MEVDKIYNPNAYDYDYPTEIYDPLTGKVYLENNIPELSDEIKHRLCVRGTKVGCMVDSMEKTQRELIKEYGD